MRNLIFIILITLVAPYVALAANIYEVKNATATASNRDQTMLDAQNKAFDELQERLITNKYITKKQKISTTRISTAVDSVDVVEEKPTEKSFKGTYNISFSPYEVSKIFNIQQISPTKEPEKFLVIPIIAENNTIKLWKNDWWPIWNNLNHDPIIMPLGDLQDIQNLKVEDLSAHHLTGLTKIAERYGANNIVLLQAQYTETSQSLNVQLEKIKGKEKTVINYEYPGGANIEQDDLYQAAAEDIAYRLQNDKLTAENLTTVLDNVDAKPNQPDQPLPRQVPTQVQIPAPYSVEAPGAGILGQKHAADEPPPPQLEPAPITKTKPAPPAKPTTKSQRSNPPATTGTNTSETIVAAPDLAAWQRIRGKISAIPGVTIKIKSLSDGRAYITLSYSSDIEALKKSLANQGLLAINSGTNLAIKEQ